MESLSSVLALGFRLVAAPVTTLCHFTRSNFFRPSISVRLNEYPTVKLSVHVLQTHMHHISEFNMFVSRFDLQISLAQRNPGDMALLQFIRDEKHFFVKA